MAEDKFRDKGTVSSKDVAAIFPGIQLPEDIINFIFNFLDTNILLKVMLVNKNWLFITKRRIPQAYYTTIPLFLKSSYVIKSMHDNLKFPFNGCYVCTKNLTKAYKEIWFHNYMQYFFNKDVKNEHESFSVYRSYRRYFFNENIKTYETFSQYSTRISQLFIEKYQSHFSKENAVWLRYIDKELKNCGAHVSFFFDEKNIHLLHFSYDIESGTVKKNVNYSFIMQYLTAAKKIDALLSVLVLFDKMQHFRQSEEWKPLKNPQWTRALTGSGLVALTAYTSPSLLLTLITCSLGELRGYNIFTLEEAQYFLKKLRSSDLASVLLLIGPVELIVALEKQQPQLLALLCNGSLASDTIMIDLLTLDANRFFKMLGVTSVLAQRVKTTIFIERFWTLTHSSTHSSEILKKHLSFEDYAPFQKQIELLENNAFNKNTNPIVLPAFRLKDNATFTGSSSRKKSENSAKTTPFSSETSGDKWSWCFKGLLFLMSLSMLISILGIAHIPFAVTICEALAHIFTACTPEAATWGMGIITASLGLMMLISSLITSCFCETICSFTATKFDESEGEAWKRSYQLQFEQQITQNGLHSYSSPILTVCNKHSKSSVSNKGYFTLCG